jgi:hypothetical protein
LDCRNAQERTAGAGRIPGTHPAPRSATLLYQPEAKAMTEDLDAMLAPSRPEVRELALGLRALVQGLFPEAIEQLDQPARLIGYGFDRSYKGLVCAIALQSTYVNLMFARGAELTDPDRLLVGTGKRARHVKIRRPEDIGMPAVQVLIEHAIRTHPHT